MGTKVLPNIVPSSLSRHSSSEAKRYSGLSSDSRRKVSLFKPTPLNFDSFIPWVCLEWQVPISVTVQRINQEKCPRTGRKTSSGSRSKSMKNVKQKEDGESISKKETSPSNTAMTRSYHPLEKNTSITAIYDSYGHLVEISIGLCCTPLHRKIVHAIGLCIPFHAFLKKLVIRKGCLDYVILYEISKLLPNSNLTDVCLDDSYVPEGNHYVVLEQASNIKYLSLNRCTITDEVCKEIALRIYYGQPAERSLLVLDLSSNKITDLGAKHFGEMLRSNRHLLHLNVSGNEISDMGLEWLVKHLKEFQLTFDEICAKKRRRMDYLRKKNEIYECCLKELTNRRKSEYFGNRSASSTRQAKFRKQKRRGFSVIEEPSLTDIAEKMTLEILGKHVDHFRDDNVSKRDNNYYCMGNLIFCSLNVAYNNIEFPSLLRILEVLRYQNHESRHSYIACKTGLMKIVLDGNYLPNRCPELDRIDVYMKMASASRIPNNHSPPVVTKKECFHPVVKQTFQT